MKSFLRAGLIGAAALVISGSLLASADYLMTQGSGTTFGSVVVGGKHYVQSLLCDLTTPGQCAAVSAGGAVSVGGSVSLTGATNNINNVSGTVSLPTGASTAAKQPALGTAGSASADVLTVQGIASMTPLTVTGLGGTFPVTQSGNWTNRIVGNAGVVLDFSGQNALSPSGSLLTGCQFNTSPTTITSGNASPIQCDNAGNALVNIKAGTVAATQSGTWTVQPGNTANTTAWLVTGTGGVFPATQSGAWNITNITGTVSLPTNAATSTIQTNGAQKSQIVDGSGNVIASTSNNLNVQCANCSGAGASAVDAASFTAGASVFGPSGGFFQTTATSNPLTSGQQGMLQMTATRAAFTNLRNAAGTEVGTTAAPLAVQGSGTAGSAAANVVTVQGIASMTKLLVTPDSVALPANQSVNVSQVNGVTTLTGTGAVGAGAQRVAVGSDTATIAGSAPGTAGTASANVLTVQGIASMTPIIVNQGTSPWSSNTAQVNGVTVLTGTGAVGTGAQRVAVGSDTSTIAGSAPGTAGTASANVLSVQGIASMTPLLVTPTANSAVNVAQINGVTPLMGNGVTGTGSPRVTIASDNTAFSVNSTPKPATTGGVTNFVFEPAASDNHTVIKNGAGQVYGIHVFNNSATINYGRLYNAGTGFNGCNSATGLAYEFHIPASTSDAGFVVPIPLGLAFATGISLCVTGAYGQTSTTNATASAISLNVLYN